MRRFLGFVLSVVGVLFAVCSWLYLFEVWNGIQKHTPPCAPIRSSTVFLVFTFTAAGAVISFAAASAARQHRTWRSVALLALFLNLAACATWGFWIGNQRLLPYNQFCEKVGMP
jgi:hypothetical protein